jgi:hypothetical protein
MSNHIPRGSLIDKISANWKKTLFICLFTFFLSAFVSSLFSVNPFASLKFKKEYLKIVLLYVATSTTFARTASGRPLGKLLRKDALKEILGNLEADSKKIWSLLMLSQWVKALGIEL